MMATKAKKNGNQTARMPKTRLSVEAIDQNALAPEDRWLSPKQAAPVIGVDEKWLAAARGGLKGVEGPPFRKIGKGRTSPVRYNLARLKQWLNQFPEVVDSMGTKSSLPNITAFYSGIDPGAEWLFALPDNVPPVDFFEALNEGTLEKKNLAVAWLDQAQWARRKSQAVFALAKKIV